MDERGDTWSEQYRLECYARHLLNTMSVPALRAWLDKQKEPYRATMRALLNSEHAKMREVHRQG